MPSFKIISSLAAGVTFLLFVTLLLVPSLIFWVFQIPMQDSGIFFARRAAMLFLGTSLLMFLCRNAVDSELRRAIAALVCVSMTGLALVGCYEFFRGFAGVGIWLAIIVEIAFAVSFFRFWKA